MNCLLVIMHIKTTRTVKFFHCTLIHPYEFRTISDHNLTRIFSSKKKEVVRE